MSPEFEKELLRELRGINHNIGCILFTLWLPFLLTVVSLFFGGASLLALLGSLLTSAPEY